MIWIKDIIYEIFNYLPLSSILTLTSVNIYFYQLICNYNSYKLFLRHQSLISCGNNYSMIVKQNKLYIAGLFSEITYHYFTYFTKDVLSTSAFCNNYFILTTNTVYYNQINLNREDVVAVIAGYKHGILLTKNSIDTIGDNKYGQISIPDHLNSNTIDKVACGAYHTIIIQKGLVYGCGLNRDGQLGDKNSDNYNQLKLIDLTDKCVDVCCGYNYTLLLTEKNEVYGMGRNFNGQLGLGESNYIYTPTKIIEDIIDIKCGEEFSLFLKKDGQVYGCGCSFYGQLNNIKYFYSTLIKIEIKFNNLSCGENHFIYKYKNKYYGKGSNKYSKLGLGQYTNKKYRKPQLINF